jgi:hypothetical protein
LLTFCNLRRISALERSVVERRVHCAEGSIKPTILAAIRLRARTWVSYISPRL